MIYIVVTERNLTGPLLFNNLADAKQYCEDYYAVTPDEKPVWDWTVTQGGGWVLYVPGRLSRVAIVFERKIP